MAEMTAKPAGGDMITRHLLCLRPIRSGGEMVADAGQA
jgi:hypothetical protein